MKPTTTTALFLQKTAFVASPLSATARGENGITFRFNNNQNQQS
jgi:hypothetical protein